MLSPPAGPRDGMQVGKRLVGSAAFDVLREHRRGAFAGESSESLPLTDGAAKLAGTLEPATGAQDTMKIDFVLNGTPRQVDVRSDEWFLHTLRERCGVTSLKDGCSPQGQCGCCVALVDGKPKTTCAMPAQVADGKHIVTLDGLPSGRARADRRLLRRHRRAAVRLLHPRHRAARQGDHRPRTRADARGDRPGAGRAPVPLHRLREDHRRDRVAGRRQARRRDHPAGRAPTAGSASRWRASAARRRCSASGPSSTTCTVPGMLHGALVLSPHPRARVLRIDTTRARALPGVRAVATAADVPGERWYGLLYNDWPGFVAEGEEVRYVGDVLAAVAAVDRHTARAAAELVDVSYEVLPRRARPAAGAGARRAPRVNPQHDNLLGPLGHAARRRRRGAGRQRARGQRHLADAAHRAPLPRARERARRAAARRPAAPVHAGPGHLRRPPPGGALPGRARRADLRRAGAQRRRLRRQGGHVGAGADRAAGAR